MKLSTMNKLDEKRRFVARIQTLLEFDEKNNQVDRLEYEMKFYSENRYEEFIHVVYQNGYTRTLVVTGNSNGANLKAVAKEVYK